MKSISELTNSELLIRTQDLSLNERKTTTAVLWHLKEIERRRLHLEIGFSSIFEYAVKELKYSEGSASRRINAMRLLKDFSQVAPLLEDGSFNLSNLSAVQSFLKTEKNMRGRIYSSK